MLATEIVPSSQFQIYPRLKIFSLENCGKLFSSNYRELLREELLNTLRDCHYSTPTTLQNVALRPQHAQLSLSLSHAQETSCFAWVDRNHKIGVDIETLSRLKKETIERVSTPHELSSAPQWELLWSCKEAVFKCFSDEQEVISFVEIFDWKKTSADSWVYSAREEKSKKVLKGKGEVRLNLSHSLAFFVSPP